MPWYFYAILGPLLWAIVNQIDKYLVERFYGKNEDNDSSTHPGSLVLFSSIFGVVVAFIILAVDKPVFTLSIESVLLLLLAGIMNCVAIILYLIAIQEDEISSVAPMFLLQVVFAYVIGLFILNEVLVVKELVAVAVVVFGAVSLSTNVKNKKIVFNKRSILFVAGACLLAVLASIIFKYVALESDFWEAQFWQYIGLGFAGLMIFVFIKQLRIDFLTKMKTSGFPIFSLNIGSEILTVVGNLLVNAAILIAPAAIIYTFVSFQALYVFLLSLLLSKIKIKGVGEQKSVTRGIIKLIIILGMIYAATFLF